MSETITKEQIGELLESIKSQFIEPYQNKIDAIHNISTSTKLKDSTALLELSKLSQLIKSQSTKLGIVTQPENFNAKNYRAIYTELQELIKSIFYLLSLVPLFHKDPTHSFTKLFLKKLDAQLLALISSLSMLIDEISKKLEETKSDENRLMAIGLLWSVCDSLNDLTKKGNFGLLRDYISDSASMVDDTLTDIKEWLDDPQLEDNFFGDEEEEEEDANPSDNEEDTKALERMEVFLKEWETNLKLIKLLLVSFKKSVSKTTYEATESNAVLLDEFQELHSQLGLHIDDFISGVFMSDASFQPNDFDEDIETLNKDLTQIVKIIREINKKDPANSKWIKVWETKYFKL
ncbi:hypothetical protein NCAS_0D03020 [Naumovozyma castellii]|uniref:Cyclin-D1-binding protein 1-like N-terminal domain-containing protein n=1 Tax=Naumovozyma castellii TaxID=27288 RepID=G0VE92_NAUCA|nr:hypothetical protein NCAS_0D03020 [Naumovozyma castellii CBS 4309]CCC69883.1 hypothetical protein NCAS_0D03020 [Naumovozyma castellii CBS 4309]